MRTPFVAVACDAGIRLRETQSKPHPRGAGNNPRVLAKYVREQGVLDLPLAIHIILSYTVLYSIMFWLAVFGWWREVLMLWLLPHYIASAMIIFFFAYLVHEPHEATDRYRDTNIFIFKNWGHKLITWAYCFQNYHLIHHLYPRIPFYRYPEVYDEVKPILEGEKSNIIEV